MIYKRCGRCGKRLPSGMACPCADKEKRVYKKAEGIKKEYHTKRWKDMRAYVLARYNGLDLYLLYRYHQAIPADTVHHIEPARESQGLFYDADNLFPVSRKGHEEIHERYKKERPEIVKKELKTYQKRFLEAFL